MAVLAGMSRISSILSIKPGSSSVLSSSKSQSSRAFSISAASQRNTPARRPRDPLDTSVDAIRHHLPTGETFIVRPPPSTSSPFNLESSQKEVVTYPASTLQLPPALRPSRPKGQNQDKLLSESDIAKIQTLRRQDPIQFTVSRLAKQFKCSPAIIQIAAPLSPEIRKAKEMEVETRRANWGANKTLQRELRKERKALW